MELEKMCQLVLEVVLEVVFLIMSDECQNKILQKYQAQKSIREAKRKNIAEY